MSPVSRRSPLAFLVVSASVAMFALTGLPAQGFSVGKASDKPDNLEAAVVEVAGDVPEGSESAEIEAGATLESAVNNPDDVALRRDIEEDSPQSASGQPAESEQSEHGAADGTVTDDADATRGEDETGRQPQGDAAQSGEGISADGTQSDMPQPVSDSSPFRRARNAPPFFANPKHPSLRPFGVATGGEGSFKENILWLEWPNGQLLDGQSSFTLHSYRDVTPRVRVVTSCTLSNLRYRNSNGKGGISAYTPGGWYGDFLDKLYNRGGVGESNSLRVGIKNTADHMIPEFNLDCTAQVLTRSSADPNARFTSTEDFPIDGLVFTDAESANYGNNIEEWVEATTSKDAEWFVLDTISDPRTCPIPGPREPRPSTANGNRASAVFSSLNGRTIRILSNGVECTGSKGTPGAVLFVQGTSSMRLSLKGQGTQALALGVILPSDLGDAPESYGEAVALYHPKWRNAIPEGMLNLHRGAAHALMGSPEYVLGRESDHDTSELYSEHADRDTNDDAISETAAYFEVYPGETVTKNVRCKGGGAVAGWVDWNVNGKFDSNEKSDEVPCKADSVDLSWTVPMDVLRAVQNENFNPRQTVMRLRTAALHESSLGGGKPLQPTGATLSGEVEDHGVQLFVPHLKLENKVISRSPYVTTLRPATDWKVKAVHQRNNPAQNKEFSANGSFTSSVPLGNFVLSVEGANGQPIPGYVNDGWACVKTPNSHAPRGKNYASTFNAAASRLNIPQADHVTCTITHRPIPGELVWRKVDQQGNLLSGSEWQVRGPSAQFGARVVDCKQAPCSAGVGALRDADPRPGVMRVDHLQWGAYTLTETKAPAGYVLSADMKSANVEGVTDLGKIVNEMHQPLVIPLTGGTASIFYVLAGGGLTVVAVAGAAAIGNRGRSRG